MCSRNSARRPVSPTDSAALEVASRKYRRKPSSLAFEQDWRLSSYRPEAGRTLTGTEEPQLLNSEIVVMLTLAVIAQRKDRICSLAFLQDAKQKQPALHICCHQKIFFDMFPTVIPQL